MCKILNSKSNNPTQSSLQDDFDNWYRSLKSETELHSVDFILANPVEYTTNKPTSFVTYLPQNSITQNSFDISRLSLPQLFYGDDLLESSIDPVLGTSTNENIFSDVAPSILTSWEPETNVATEFVVTSPATYDPAVKIEEPKLLNEEEKKISTGVSGQKRKRSSNTSTPAEPISEALAFKRQKQNEAARKSRQKKLNMLQEAQERAEKAEKEVAGLKERILLLEAEKTEFLERENQLKRKFHVLLQNIDSMSKKSTPCFGSNFGHL